MNSARRPTTKQAAPARSNTNQLHHPTLTIVRHHSGWLDQIASWLLAAGVWLLTPAQNLNIARRFVGLKAMGKGLGLRVATRLLGCLTVWPFVRHIDLPNKNN